LWYNLILQEKPLGEKPDDSGVKDGIKMKTRDKSEEKYCYSITKPAHEERGQGFVSAVKSMVGDTGIEPVTSGM